VVYAAIRALGWLEDVSADGKIEAVSSAFWLPEVHDLGVKTIAALRLHKGRSGRPIAASMDLAEGPFEINQSVLRQVAACPSHHWRWQDSTFDMPTSAKSNTRSLSLWGGTLSGTDSGEFIGELSWIKEPAQSVSILKDNVRALSAVEGTKAIAMFGLAHMGFDYGYVLRVERTPDGMFNLSEVAQLPAEGDAMVSLAPDLFAVTSASRTVVVSFSKGILGLAKCQ
jgi:hypothetical protein